MLTLTFYVFFEIVALFFMYSAQRKRKKYKIKNTKRDNVLIVKKYYGYLFLSAFPIIFLLGFRDISVGYDTKEYVYTFFRIANGSIIASDYAWLSYGYIFICKIIGFFSKNGYLLYNLIIAVLTIYFFYKALWRNSKNPVFSLFLLFSTCLVYQAFNQSRQMLAVAIITYSWGFLEKEDLKKYLILIFLAFTIHKSAIIMLPFYWLSKRKISKKNIFIYIGIALLFLFSLNFIEKILFFTHYGQVYLEKGMFISQTSSILNLVFRCCVLFICSFFYRYIQANDKIKLNKLMNISIWCVLFQLLTLKIYIFARITTYLYVFYVFLISNIYENIKNKKKKQIFIIIMCLIFLIFHIGYYNSVSHSSGYDVYKFIFN